MGMSNLMIVETPPQQNSWVRHWILKPVQIMNYLWQRMCGEMKWGGGQSVYLHLEVEKC